jgi:prepilin-type N-terminal cleavage/methylation domain-containing protein
MNRLRSDEGFTLIEVIVAMMLFGIISVSVVGALVGIRTISATANLRQTAQNLAAGALDAARNVDDVTTLTGTTTSKTVGGRSFTIRQSVGWVGSVAGSQSQCSSGSGAMIARSVTETVSWNGLGGNKPVTISTIVAPQSRLNDAGDSAILVSVRDATGAGLGGVTASARPAATNPHGATTTAGPFTTDADGCVYITGLTPGNYDVTVSKAAAGNPYVGSDQTPSPLTATGVTAAADNAGSAPFQLDQSVRFSVGYGSNLAPGFLLPTNLQASFENNYGIWSPASLPAYLHPYRTGYSVVAGVLAQGGDTAPSCAAVDPGSWPSYVSPADPTLSWSAQTPVATGAAPGGAVTAQVPMGALTLTGHSGPITAVGLSADPAGTSNPGCASPTNYSFTVPTSGATVLALPYGYWQLMAGSTPIPASDIAVSAPNVLESDASGNAVVVLDPRVSSPTPTEPVQ